MELCLDVDPKTRNSIANNKTFHAFLIKMANETSATNIKTYEAAYKSCAAAWKKVLDEEKAQKKRKALHEIIKPKKKSRLQALVADSHYASVSRYQKNRVDFADCR